MSLHFGVSQGSILRQFLLKHSNKLLHSVPKNSSVRLGGTIGDKEAGNTIVTGNAGPPIGFSSINKDRYVDILAIAFTDQIFIVFEEESKPICSP